MVSSPESILCAATFLWLLRAAWAAVPLRGPRHGPLRAALSPRGVVRDVLRGVMSPRRTINDDRRSSWERVLTQPCEELHARCGGERPNVCAGACTNLTELRSVAPQQSHRWQA